MSLIEEKPEEIKLVGLGGEQLRSHEHTVAHKYWLGKPYYWCPDCGVAAAVDKSNANDDPQALLDKAGKELARA